MKVEKKTHCCDTCIHNKYGCFLDEPCQSCVNMLYNECAHSQKEHIQHKEYWDKMGKDCRYEQQIQGVKYES